MNFRYSGSARTRTPVDNGSHSGVPSKNPKFSTSFSWTDTLNQPDCVAADVSWFKHAPVSSLWGRIEEGQKVEVENPDKSCWVARIIGLKGYKALLRYEGLEDDSSDDFWVHLCSKHVHHLNWRTPDGESLPYRYPSSVETKLAGFKKTNFENAETLPSTFQSRIITDLTSKYCVSFGSPTLEITDIEKMSQIRVASVERISGKRLYGKYFDTKEEFWCHEESSLVHAVGWATTVGHAIDFPESLGYCPSKLSARYFNTNCDTSSITEGMKLETVDTTNFLDFKCATVKKVLKYGFLMIQVDPDAGNEKQLDWVCHHITSPYIFPVGFSDDNGLTLIPPLPYNKRTFEWKKYLSCTKSCALSLSTWTAKSEIEHGFKEKMKLEAADIKNPESICVATVSKVVGRLLKIHFDGWGEEYDMWVDVTSPDIYPVGWCELVGHTLKGPTESMRKRTTTLKKVNPALRTRSSARLINCSLHSIGLN